MAQQVDRRDFMKASAAVAAGAAMGVMLAPSANAQPTVQAGANGMPMGQIKNLKLSRLPSPAAT